jgi:hypothetical protein
LTRNYKLTKLRLIKTIALCEDVALMQTLISVGLMWKRFK